MPINPAKLRQNQDICRTLTAAHAIMYLLNRVDSDNDNPAYED